MNDKVTGIDRASLDGDHTVGVVREGNRITRVFRMVDPMVSFDARGIGMGMRRRWISREEAQKMFPNPPE